VVNY